MTSQRRPRIAILGRFAESTSATRHDGLVLARRLGEAIWAAGGDPITLLPVADSNWDERLVGINGVLMPGGADVDPRAYGQEPASDALYGIDLLQDAVDMSLVHYALENSLPLFTICRGTQVANVALGGSLVQNMDKAHYHHVASMTVQSYVEELGLANEQLTASCYHHQIIDQLGTGIEPIAYAAEGHIEAVKISGKAWSFGVQWHPEDNYAEESNQFAILKKFVSEAAKANPIG